MVSRLFDDGHSGWCKVVLQSVFDLHFSNKISDVEHLFMCFLAICLSYLENCLFRSSAHFLMEWVGFFFLVFSCKRCLQILEINPLSVYSFANIFSHVWVVLLFCLGFPLLAETFKL